MPFDVSAKYPSYNSAHKLYRYLEAVEVLYTGNHFSFRGALGVYQFQTLIAPRNWNALRHVHISTTILTPILCWNRGIFPPESCDHWQKCCRALASLSNLHLLWIDMIIWDQIKLHDTDSVDQKSLLLILGGLKSVRALKFQVELNITISDQTSDILGSVPFQILHRERPYDWEAFLIG